jgi:predicted alternative tryptophan synthase beta-subunit
MEYVILTETDVEFIDNMVVICSYMGNRVIYEPIPDELSEFFKDHKRLEPVVINKEIEKVEYDWNNEKAYITIADTNFPGPHEFNCTGTWDEQDCVNAISSKFS